MLDKFLYNHDHDCVYNILDMDTNHKLLKKLNPSYKTMRNVRRRLFYFFKDYKNRYELVNFITKEISEDINRLEIYINILAYNFGYGDTSLANSLEMISMRNTNESEIKEKFANENINDNIYIQKFKKNIFYSIHSEEQQTKYLKSIIYNFSDNIISPKIYKINKLPEKQQLLRYDEDGYTIFDSHTLISLNDLEELNKRITRSIYKNAIKIYEEAFWCGLYDRVEKRYT